MLLKAGITRAFCLTDLELLLQCTIFDMHGLHLLLQLFVVFSHLPYLLEKRLLTDEHHAQVVIDFSLGRGIIIFRSVLRLTIWSDNMKVRHANMSAVI